jgi:UDP:flavonoid glycosyltransferase YjiC (YdhE family)
MLAIENQLPMVLAGVHEGKNEINARLGYFKLGVNLGTELPRPEQIKQAALEVITSETYANNVRKLSEEFRQFDPQKMTAFYVSEVLGDNYAAFSKSIVEDEYTERLAVY